MNLETLVNRYDGDFIFRLKSKFKNFSRKTKPYRLLLGIPLWFGLSVMYNSKVKENYFENERIIINHSNRIEELNDMFEKNKERFSLEEQLRIENNIELEVKEFESNKKELIKYSENFSGDRRIFEYLFYGIIGFYVLSDLLKVKEISYKKSSLAIIGSYALSRLGSCDNLLNMNLENVYTIGVYSLNDLVILSSVNALGNISYNFSKKPGLINYPKFLYNYTKGFIKKDENSIKEAYKLIIKDKEKINPPIEIFLLNQKSENIKFVRDSIEDVILEKDLIDNLKTGSLSHSMNSFINNHLEKGIRDYAVKNTLKFNYNFIHGDYIKAFERLEKIRNHPKFSYDFSIVYALMLNKFVDNIKSNCSKYDAKGVVDFVKKYKDLDSFIDNTWGNCLDVLLKDDRTRFENIYSDHIKCIATSEFLKNALALKESSKEDLNKEFSNSQLIKYLVYDSEDFDVLNSLKVVDFDDKHYLISEFEEGPTLMKIRNLETFVKTTKFLRMIHTRLDSSKRKRDYKTEVESRMLTYDLNFIEIIKSEAWKEIWDYISKENAFFDADPHGEQYIINDKITRLDLDDKGLLEWPFQLNKLAIQSGLRSNDYEAIVNAYCNGRNLWNNCKVFLMASIPSALSYVSRTIVEDSGNNKQREVYLDFAMHACSELSMFDLKDMIKEKI